MSKSLNILVVDDTPTDRKILEHILKGAGHTVISAEDGSSAVAIAREKKPDAVFMDVVMPGMDGFKATRQISQDNETSKIPVIICSSKGRETDKDWAADNGAKGYVVKPAKKDEILNALARALPAAA
jgi:twitching motility two-component system response regulator PilH